MTSNNINLEQIKTFVSTIQKDPLRAKKNKRVTGRWVFQQGKPQFRATLEYIKDNVTLNAELPPFAGGWGTSPDPIQYCLFGLAACFAVTFAATATGENVHLTHLEVTAENWMDLRKQMGVANTNIIKKVRFTVNAAGASKKVLSQILKLTEERCPGTECITRKIPLAVKLI